jgi:hypothetical protein
MAATSSRPDLVGEQPQPSGTVSETPKTKTSGGITKAMNNPPQPAIFSSKGQEREFLKFRLAQGVSLPPDVVE